MRPTTHPNQPTLFHSDAPATRGAAPGPAQHGSDQPGNSSGTPGSLRRDQIFDRLLTLRPGMSLEFLEGFSNEALGEYLDRLESFASRKGRDARWIRTGRTPAVVTRPAASD